MLETSIANLIKKQAEKNPDAICIAAPNRKPLTYRSLYNCIEYVGAYFEAMGLGRNDRVALALPNSPEMAVAFLAVASFCTCAPLNPNYRALEFDFYLSDLQASSLIVQSGIDFIAYKVATERGISILELSPMLEAEAGIFTFKGVNKHNKHNIYSGSFAESNDVALVLHTSGTTARPKIVPLTHANLCTSANNIQTALKLSEEDCCLNVMPLFHIHGLIGTLLSSLSSGGSVVCTLGFDATKFFDWLLEFKPTWYSAVPTIHQAILAKASGARSIINNCSIRLIRSSSAALPPQVMMGLEEVFNAPVIEAYGMTEASHQMASNPLPPAIRKPGSVGIPAGLEVAIMDEFGNLLEQGAVGEIVITGANVTSGYDNPQANISAFSNGWFRTGDNGYFDSDGYLYINGRIKEIINRGGEKISPREVDEVLLDHPAIVQAVTFAVPHPTLGEDVAAAVVLRENATVTEREIYEFAFPRLADFKLPAQVVFVNEIPLGATGKLQRIGLAEKLAPKLKVQYVEPRNEIEKTLAAIWVEVLGIEKVGVYDNFFALGGDSLRVSQVIARIEAQNQVEITFFDFFAAPTLINLSQIIKSVAAKNVNSACKQNISQNNYDYPLPLSHAQQRFWLLAQLAPNSPVYNVANAMQIEGNLNVEFAQQAINAIVERHALLRSTIKYVDGQLVQIITSYQVVLQQVALSTDSFKRFIDEEIQCPFNLEQGPLLRVTLLRLDKAKHILLLVNHHIISDDWSIGLFWQEFTALYEAFSTQKSSKLQPLPIQYADFAVWQHNYVQGEYLQPQLDYWKQQLSGELPELRLPTDRARPRVETYRGSWESLAISESKTSELKNLSKSEGVTLFMTLLAAFKTLLYRYSNQEDILISTPISERNQVETERLIGCFINNLVLRTNLEGNPSFRELLQRVKKTALDAYTHRDLPFDKLIQQLQVERQISQLPFQVMFVLHNAPSSALSVHELTLTTLPIHTATAKLDLTLELQETSEGITGKFEYNTDLFDAATISRMVEHFQILLNGIITNPYQSISELPLLPLLTDVKRHQMLVEWNNTVANYPIDKCIHQLFEAQVEQNPEAIAVVFENQQLTYRELNCRANNLANYLQSLGVKPEVLVGIYIERSIEMLVGILGILKAGGAYVPLDPTYPDERLNYMLKDSRVPVLLTMANLSEKLPQSQASVVCLDTDWKKIADYSESNPISLVAPNNLAYVIYTSGSTGKPKGVLIQHKSLVNYTWAASVEYSISKRDRVLQFSSISFDASAEEIYTCLTRGATLVLRTDSMLDSVDIFVQKCVDLKLTVLALPTAYWHELTAICSARNLEFPQSLRLVIIGGEKALPKRLQTWLEYVGQRVRLINTYGPTEATIVTTLYDLSVANPASTELPIGRPIANVQTYILDQYQQPLPIGVPGELYIAGDGLARGYLNQPDLTFEKFIPNPFNQNSGSRLYKTGDLVRYLPDGNIEFLGRIDNQVKIRGFRIELGEIESKLVKHSKVKETVVVARENITGDKQLVAYIVFNTELAPTISDLRRFLKEQLPDYMVPSAFVTLDALPLIPNGKVDQSALPVPDLHSIPKHKFVAPRTPIEERLAQIWAQVLKLELVGIDDNFFELGGHSLLAMQVLSRIHQGFGIKFPLRTLFETPSIAEFAQRLQYEEGEI